MEDFGVYDRRLEIRELLLCGWRITATNWKTLAVICATVYLPLGFMDAWIEFSGNEIAVGLGKVVDFFLDLTAMVAAVMLAGKSLDGEPVKAMDVLRKSLRRVPAAFMVSVIAGIVVVALMFLLIVPGIVWAVYYTFVLQVVALRDFRGKQALDYSKSMVVGRWFDVFGTALVIGFVSLVPSVALSVGTMALSIVVPGGDTVFIGLSYTVLYSLMLYYIICMTVYFLNIEHVLTRAGEPVRVPDYLRTGLDNLNKGEIAG